METLSVELWHLMPDGRFIHIVQVTKDGVRSYYTDGVKAL
jgi:hypothetical protein